MSTISESLIGEVTDCLSSLEFWRVIETLFSRESLAKVLQVKQQLQSVRKGSSSISEFILKVKGFGNSLRSAGQTVTDQDLLLCVLNGLGHEYDPVVVMLSQQQLTMSLHEAQYMLMIHEQRIEHLNSFAQIDVPAPAANFVSQSGGRNGNRGGFASGNRGNTNNRGYSLQHKGYKCLHPSGKVYISRNVIFHEFDFPYPTLFSSKSDASNVQSSLPLSLFNSLPTVSGSVSVTPAPYSQSSLSNSASLQQHSVPVSHSAVSRFSNSSPFHTHVIPSVNNPQTVSTHPMGYFYLGCYFWLGDSAG
ncbi:hypothetical protein ACOSQ2_011520 [Xanthoceras sorbifolium]